MKLYLNDDKTHVDPRPHNGILWGLKAHCAYKNMGQRIFLGNKINTVCILDTPEYIVQRPSNCTEKKGNQYILGPSAVSHIYNLRGSKTWSVMTGS